MKKHLVGILLPVIFIFGSGIIPAYAFDSSYATQVFSKLAEDPKLRNPSVVLMDARNGDVLFESKSTSQRKPASILKLLSASAAIRHLPLDKRYETVLYKGIEPNSIIIKGQLDPWFSLKSKEAQKMHRTSLPKIASLALEALQNQSDKKVRRINLLYEGIYTRDAANLKLLYKKKGITLSYKKVSIEESIAQSGEELLRSTSPTVDEMVKWFLTWSDNVLAERLARDAAKSAGQSRDDFGVNSVFTALLSEWGIDSTKLVVDDASGLSPENKMTAQLVSQVLFKVHQDPKFSNLIDGLPDSGETGTLKKRFVDTAPGAIGLVHAKTGTLNGTVNLAGYVESGDREYIVVIIADQLPRGSKPSRIARQAVDKYLGRIALPSIPVIVALPDPSQPVISVPVA